MKLHKKQEGQDPKELNIITDNDIEISGENSNLGRRLSDVIKKHTNDIEKMKSNLAWIYKYGGIGSGHGTGGGGGTSDTKTLIRAKLNNISFDSADKAPNIAILNGPGMYDIELSLANPQLHNFRIVTSYPTDNGKTQRITTTLPNNYGTYSTTIQVPLSYDGIITISGDDLNTGNPIETNVIVRAIIHSYVLEPNIEYNDGTAVFASNNYNVFTDDINNKGLYFKCPWEINIQYDSGQSTYALYEDNVLVEDCSGVFDPDVQPISHTIYEPGTVIPDSQCISHTYKFVANIKPIDEYAEPIEFSWEVTFMILPTHFFISAKPNTGNIYFLDSIPLSEELVSKQSVSVSINPVVYYGKTNRGRNFTVKYKIKPLGTVRPTENPDWDGGEETSIILTERDSSKSLTVIQTTESWVAVMFKCTDNGVDYLATYYLYFKEPKTLDYYSHLTVASGNSYYYRAPYVNESGKTPFIQFKNETVIKQKKAFNESIVINDLDFNGTTWEDTHMAFGLQYSKVNDANQPIIRIVAQNATQYITVYQNKIVYRIGSNEIESPVYIKKCDVLGGNDGYTLLSIHFRKITEGQYECTAYINGTLESAATQFYTFMFSPESIELLPTNTNFKLIEVSYLNRDSGTEFSDLDENIYYYAYMYNVFNRTEFETEYNNLLPLFKYSTDEKNWIMLENDAVNYISNSANVPVMKLVYNPDNESSEWNSNTQDYLDNSYNASSDLNSDHNFNCSLYWSNGKGEELAEPAQGKQFYFKIQGSSTKGYKSKNFQLYISQNETSDMVNLFSPNFSPLEDGNLTFLPEKSFTLKADVVDSSHSNNVSIGKFINKNTQPFLQNLGQNMRHVKNCLDGFKFILLLEVSGATSQSSISRGEKTNTCTYYMGIYNFNLGRESYFNLGYYPNSAYDDFFNPSNPVYDVSKAGKFQVYEMDATNIITRPALLVAEVGRGDACNDFSQYDMSIIAGPDNQSGSHVEGMFGDIIRGEEIGDEHFSKIQTFVHHVSDAGAFIFDRLGKTFANQNVKYNGSIATDPSISINAVPNYREFWKARIKADTGTMEYYQDGGYTTKPNLDQALSDVLGLDQENLKTGILNTNGFISLVEYFTFCMTFGLIDSVLKNLNIKSFDSGRTFYIAFYDMDTALGKNNEGNDVAYFAFSDYWQEDRQSHVISNYTDFYPKNDKDHIYPNGYDIPSSYLFAIAKYAKLLNDDISVDTPQTLWAKMRGSNSELRNAQWFIDNYFNTDANDINDGLFNLNYRFKYLRPTMQDNVPYFPSDASKLTGRSVERVKDWLDGRLHILDGYFNMSKVSKKIQRLDLSSVSQNEYGTYNTDEIMSPIWVDTIYNEQYPADTTGAATNEDVYMMHHIFNADSSMGIQADSDVNVTFKAIKYSPVVVRKEDVPVARYLVMDDNAEYTISTTRTGSQSIYIYGSQQFTEISDISPFIKTDSTLFIKSQYLKNIYGTKGVMTNFTLASCPSLEVLSLTCPNYSGKFESIVNTESNIEPHPNLNTVDIQNTKISLDLEGTTVENININNCNSNEIKLIDNKRLNAVSLDYCKVNECIINPLWNASNYNYRFAGTSINNLTLVAQKDTNSVISISNDSALTQLTLNEFKDITLTNLVNMASLSVSSDALTSLQIIRPNDRSIACKLTTLDLSNCPNLERVIIQYTPTLASINFNGCKRLREVCINGAKLGASGSRMMLDLSNCVYYAYESCELPEGEEYETVETVDQNPTSESPTYIRVNGTNQYYKLTLKTNLTSINLEGCSTQSNESGYIKLPEISNDSISYMNLKDTKVGHIHWGSTEPSASDYGTIDLSNSTKLISTSANPTIYCTGNTGIEYLKCPNMRNSEYRDEDYLYLHTNMAIRLASFKGCSSLKRIYGNVVITETTSTFEGCTNFSIFGTTTPKYCNKPVINGDFVYMPYHLNGSGTLEFDDVPSSKYLSTTSEYRMEVKFQDDDENGVLATNMSFDYSTGTTETRTVSYDSTFANTSVTLFDVYYFFSNCMPVSYINHTNTTSIGYNTSVGILYGFNRTFSSSAFNDILFKHYIISPYMMHGVIPGASSDRKYAKCINNWFAPFYGNKTTSGYFTKLPSPSLDNHGSSNGDGWYEPLANAASISLDYTYNSSSYQGIGNQPSWMIDNDFFKTKATKYYNALHDFTCLVSNRDNLNRHVNGTYKYEDNGIKDGEITTLFDGFRSGVTLSNIWFNHLNFEHVKVSKNIKSLNNVFNTPNAVGNIKFGVMFESNSMLETLTDSFNVSGYLIENNPLMFQIDGDTLSKFENLKTISGLVGSWMYYNERVAVYRDKPASVNNVTIYSPIKRVISNTGNNFPQIFNNCPAYTGNSLETVSFFFRDAYLENDTQDTVIAFGRSLFNSQNTSIKDLSGLFYNIHFKYRIDGNGNSMFTNLKSLETVNYIFARHRNSKTLNLQGGIPYRLFDNGNNTIKNIQSFIANNPIDSYENATPTSYKDFDGVNGAAILFGNDNEISKSISEPENEKPEITDITINAFGLYYTENSAHEISKVENPILINTNYNLSVSYTVPNDDESYTVKLYRGEQVIDSKPLDGAIVFDYIYNDNLYSEFNTALDEAYSDGIFNITDTIYVKIEDESDSPVSTCMLNIPVRVFKYSHYDDIHYKDETVIVSECNSMPYNSWDVYDNIENIKGYNNLNSNTLEWHSGRSYRMHQHVAYAVEGKYRFFYSLSDNNTAEPTDASNWGTLYDIWDTSATYMTGDKVYVPQTQLASSVMYTSKTDNNQGHTTSGGDADTYWESSRLQAYDMDSLSDELFNEIEYFKEMGAVNNLFDTPLFGYNENNSMIAYNKDYRYCCPPDLLFYLNNNSDTNIDSLFYGCGGGNNQNTSTSDSIVCVDYKTTYYQTIQPTRTCGLTGRMVPYLFMRLSNITHANNLFTWNKTLSYYNENITLLPDYAQMENWINGRYYSNDEMIKPVRKFTVNGEIEYENDKYTFYYEQLTNVISDSTLPTEYSTDCIIFNNRLYKWNGTAYLAEPYVKLSYIPTHPWSHSSHYIRIVNDYYELKQGDIADTVGGLFKSYVIPKSLFKYTTNITQLSSAFAGMALPYTFTMDGVLIHLNKPLNANSLFRYIEVFNKYTSTEDTKTDYRIIFKDKLFNANPTDISYMFAHSDHEHSIQNYIPQYYVKYDGRLMGGTYVNSTSNKVIRVFANHADSQATDIYIDFANASSFVSAHIFQDSATAKSGDNNYSYYDHDEVDTEGHYKNSVWYRYIKANF